MEHLTYLWDMLGVGNFDLKFLSNGRSEKDVVWTIYKTKASVGEEVNVHRSKFEKNAFKVFKLKQFISCLILTLSSQGRYCWV